MNKSRALHTFGLAVVSGLAWLAVHLKDSPYWWAPAGAALAAALVVQLPKVLPSVFGPLLVLMALTGTASCWLTKPPPVSPAAPDGGFADASAGQAFKDCSDVALHAAWLGLLPDIETAVATSGAAVDAIVAQVAATAGIPLAVAEVTCGLHYLVDRITHSQQVAPDSLEAKKLANAQAWLAAHPGSP